MISHITKRPEVWFSHFVFSICLPRRMISAVGKETVACYGNWVHHFQPEHCNYSYYTTGGEIPFQVLNLTLKVLCAFDLRK